MPTPAPPRAPADASHPSQPPATAALALGSEPRMSSMTPSAAVSVRSSAVTLHSTDDGDSRIDSRSAVKSASTLSQSVSTRFSSSRIACRYDTPPPARSLTHALFEYGAAIMEATTPWPDCSSADSSAATSSRTNCATRWRWSRLACSTTSRMMSPSSGSLWSTALPDTNRCEREAPRCRVGPAEKLADTPPVCAPTRRDMATSSYSAVPSADRQRANTGSSGMADAATPAVSTPKPKDRYAMRLVGWSCRRMVACPARPATSRTRSSRSIQRASLFMSATDSRGMHASASGGSGVCCRFFSSSATSAMPASSSGVSCASTPRRRSSSAASSPAASAGSGTWCTVTRCWLSSSRRRTRPSNTRSPASTRRRSSAKAAS
mmetsp:Transcript_19873/g.70321  ORF Transcript_19873/g.70321 Transcript_19873/m.70321 type:complete len:378 (-) Transcript_19873:534-1667(-)